MRDALHGTRVSSVQGYAWMHVWVKCGRETPKSSLGPVAAMQTALYK